MVGWCSATDSTGAFLIDRSPEYFEPLLNFLRHNKLILNEGINPQGEPSGKDVRYHIDPYMYLCIWVKESFTATSKAIMISFSVVFCC